MATPDMFTVLVDAAGLLVTAAGNSVGPVLGATGALGFTGIMNLIGVTGSGTGRVRPGPTGIVPTGRGATGSIGSGSSGATGSSGSGSGSTTRSRVNPTGLGSTPGMFTRIKSRVLTAVSTPSAGRPVTLPYDKRFKSGALVPVAPKDGSIAAIFMLWQDKILIQKRAADPATISCPSGFLENGESFEEAAVRELEEEAQFSPAPDSEDLTLFHRTQTVVGGTGPLRDMAFYYCLVKDPAISTPGPVAPGEVDTVYNFADVPGAVVYDDNSGHAWITPTDLETYIFGTTGPALSDIQTSNPIFAEAVAKFMEVEDDAFGRPIPDIDLKAAIPAWATDYFEASDVPTECDKTTFIGPDCLAKAVLREVMVAEQFKKSGRLRKNPTPSLKQYVELAEEFATLKAMVTRSQEQEVRFAYLEQHLSSHYPDRLVHIHSVVDNAIHTFTVPNPYKALAYREDRRAPVNFADPSSYSGSKHNLNKDMYRKNIKLLNALAPPQMLADSTMSTALLESLWFCGSNPSLSDDPRCNPLKVLGELHEWQANKAQTAAGRKAEDTQKESSSWSVVRDVMVALENAVKGAEVYPFLDMFRGRVAKVKVPTGSLGATGPTAPTGTGPVGVTGPTSPTGTGSAAPKPGRVLTLALGGPIIPFSLGGGGSFAPLIPLTLGGGS